MGVRTISKTIDLSQLPKESKYITEINQNGITIHPELISTNSYYTLIDGNGLKINKVVNSIINITNDTTIANFGSTINIGDLNSNNILIDSNGFSIRNGTLPMMVLDNDSLDFNVVNTTAGTFVPTATFSSTGAQIGQTGESHIEMDYHSMQLVDRDGNLYFYVSDLRDRDGNVYIEDAIESTGQLRAYRLSHICDTTKSISVYVNGSLVSDENYSIGFNQMLQTSRIDFTYTPPIGTIIVEYYAIGQNAKALTFGIRNGEVGAMSVGLGYNVVADGTYSFAEGQESVASGATSHAEGWGTLAGSSCCHAEGNHTKALGANSHASGYFTQANYYQQFVCGAYNDNKSGNVFEIGNGSADDARSNALTVDWNGQVQCQGITPLDNSYREIYIGDYTSRAQQINTSLTTSSADDAWLTATLKAICADYPGETMTIFRGQLHPNSYGYFEICIYNTSTLSGGMPQYSHGTWRHWQNTFWIISTSNYAFSYAAK